MDPRFFRKYADLVESAEQDKPVQLDEGIASLLKPLAMKFVKMIGPDALQDIAAQVKQATGGDLSATKDNAMKVAQAFGLGKKSDAVAEGIAGNWQGKLQQLVYASGLLGSVAGMASMWGTPGASFAGVVGLVLLMAIGAAFGDEAGQLGAMGKYGNTGTDLKYGSDMPKRT